MYSIVWSCCRVPPQPVSLIVFFSLSCFAQRLKTIPLSFLLVCRNDLLLNPPGALQESYYRCIPKPLNAFLEAAGIAEGNTEVAMPIVLVGLFLALTLIELSGYFPKSPEKYSLGQTAETLEHFAHMVLIGKVKNLTADKAKAKDAGSQKHAQGHDKQSVGNTKKEVKSPVVHRSISQDIADEIKRHDETKHHVHVVKD